MRKIILAWFFLWMSLGAALAQGGGPGPGPIPQPTLIFPNIGGTASPAQMGASPANHAAPIDVGGTPTWRVVPDCQDTGGQHLNYTQSTDLWSCGDGFGGSISITAGTGIVVSPSPITGTGSVALATVSADQLLLNATGGSAAPTGQTIPNCSTSNSALSYSTMSHTLGCNTISGIASGVSGQIAAYTGATTVGGSANLTFATATLTVGNAGSATGILRLGGATSGNTSLTGATTGGGTWTLRSVTTDNVVGAATTDTLTNKTFDTAGTGNVFKINGTGISSVTGIGAAVLANTPTLITPVLGVATATSINKVAITAPASASTLTVANGKTLTANNTVTLADGTDGHTWTGQSADMLLAALNLPSQPLQGGWAVTSESIPTGSYTVEPDIRPLQFITNGGAFSLIAPVVDGWCQLLVTNNASAGAITFSGWTVGSNTGDSLDTVNGHKFTIDIWRINGVAGYFIHAMQ